SRRDAGLDLQRRSAQGGGNPGGFHGRFCPPPRLRQCSQRTGNGMSNDIESDSPAPALGEVRSRIDGIDRAIQELIAERARWAHQVGLAKGPLAAAVDYYRPEREAQVLRMVVDRNEGPLSDEVLVHVFREI